jgi:hypothetical protein
MEKNWEATKEEWQYPVLPEYLTEKKEYVFCLDTLGQDREITEEEQKYVEEMCKLFS